GTPAIAARLAAREERIKLLEEENRWLKAQLFGRSSEKTPAAEVSPDQRWLFNEAETLAQAAQSAPERILIAAHERKKRGRKPLSPDLPRGEVLHDLADHEKLCPQDGTVLEHPLIHSDETRLQVLHSDKAPTAEHWMWVRASGPPGRRIVLFDYDASRGGAVPKRLLQDYRGILLSDGWEPYATVAQELGLVHAGCLAHARRKFDEARKATPGDSGHARTALDFIR